MHRIQVRAGLAAALGHRLVAAFAAAAVLAPAATTMADSSAARTGDGPRIVNGLSTQSRPTTGALLVETGPDEYGQICSGTLIGCETFLTAAHCVCSGLNFATCGTPLASEFSVYLQHAGVVAVSAIDVDSTYSFGNRGDVAVLTLATTTSGIPPMPINTTMRPSLGSTAEIAGFGLTHGNNRDSGLLREGAVETASCAGSVDSSFHVCWDFEEPLDAAGMDSNTCSGDSGGPLFVDFGGGLTVAGITSGGDAADCQPIDLSFDTDVYVHRTFIEGVGGLDLLNATCGAVSQVGDMATTVEAFEFATFDKSQRACRKVIAKTYSTYVKSALKAEQACRSGVIAGKRSAPCPDATATTALARAAAKVSETKLARRCPTSILPTVGLAGDCAAVASAADLADCILAAGDGAVIDALDVEYADADPMATIADSAVRSCQQKVAVAGAVQVRTELKALTKCAKLLDLGSIASCPDTKASTLLAKAQSKASAQITSSCDDAAVATLDAAGTFGATCAGVSTAADLATCQGSEHSAITGALLGTLDEPPVDADVTFTVPPGATALRVTLNGVESGSNDLDLYVRRGAPATSLLYDARSVNGGMFEGLTVASPMSGTWYAHVEHFSGAAQISYQLTATSFQ